jgi:hypothetical protein
VTQRDRLSEEALARRSTNKISISIISSAGGFSLEKIAELLEHRLQDRPDRFVPLAT